MTQDKKPPPKEKPLDEHGLDPNVRKRILSYGAPDRRETGPKEKLDVPKRRRDDRRESKSHENELERLDS